MQLIDSHCHLHLLDLAKDSFGSIQEVIANAVQHDVAKILCVSVEWHEFEIIKKLREQYPQFIYGSMGQHPSNNTNKLLTVDDFVKRQDSDFIIAIGETGLDYGHDIIESQKHMQQQNFITHIAASKLLKKPLIIHTRYANNDTIAILKQESADEIGGVMHCFTETWEMAKQCLEQNMYLSFSGIITFKNAAELREVVKKVPIERILIETDAPYLAPVPFRGKQNQPAWVRYVAEAVAQIKNLPLELVAAQTTANFEKCFKLVR
jgi:TatD DNase family protein